MEDDSDNLVVAATFEDPTEAALARNRLEALGVRTVLGEENSANLGWASTGAGGAIKLLVAEADLARCRHLLSEKPWARAERAGKNRIRYA